MEKYATIDDKFPPRSKNSYDKLLPQSQENIRRINAL